MTSKSDLSSRVHTLLAKTRSKLSLNKSQAQSKFETNFKQFKQLKTFVNSQKQIQKLNPLNNQELLKQIQKYFLHQKLKKLSKQPYRSLVTQIEQDQFYQELDFENERDTNIAKTINFGRAANLNTRKSIDIDQYLQAKSVIKRASFMSINRSLPEFEVKRSEQFNTQPSNNFFDSISKQMKEQEEKYLDKDLREFEQQELEALESLRLEEIARKYGLTEEENMEDQIFRSYRKQSNVIIRQNIEEARRIYEGAESSPKRRTGFIRAKAMKLPFLKLRSQNQELHEKMRVIHNECKNRVFSLPLGEEIEQLQAQFLELSERADFKKQLENHEFAMENQRRVGPVVKSKFARQMEKKQQRVMRILKYQN